MYRLMNKTKHNFTQDILRIAFRQEIKNSVVTNQNIHPSAAAAQIGRRRGQLVTLIDSAAQVNSARR